MWTCSCGGHWTDGNKACMVLQSPWEHWGTNNGMQVYCFHRQRRSGSTGKAQRAKERWEMKVLKITEAEGYLVGPCLSSILQGKHGRRRGEGSIKISKEPRYQKNWKMPHTVHQNCVSGTFSQSWGRRLLHKMTHKGSLHSWLRALKFLNFSSSLIHLHSLVCLSLSYKTVCFYHYPCILGPILCSRTQLPKDAFWTQI